MKIELFQKYNIFSNVASVLLIPKTSWKVRIYPTLLILEDLLSHSFIKLKMNIEGPVKEFRIFLNLQKGWIQVQGFSKKGFFRYRIYAVENKICISLDKFFEGFSFDSENNFSAKIVQDKKLLSFTSDKIDTFEPKMTKEILFLGSTKKQDIELIDRREDMTEVLPILYLWAQFFSKAEKPRSDICSLLDQLEEDVSQKKKEQAEKMLLSIYKVGFSHLMMPRLKDDEYQGIIDEKILPEGNPIYLLNKGYELIRKLFFQNEKNIFHILPCLPKGFHCGKLLNLQIEGFGTLSLEWSKKILKKMVFNCKKDFDLKLKLQSKLNFFRIRTKRREKGRKVSVKETLSLEEGKIYFFDRFQK